MELQLIMNRHCNLPMRQNITSAGRTRSSCNRKSHKLTKHGCCEVRTHLVPSAEGWLQPGVTQTHTLSVRVHGCVWVCVVQCAPGAAEGLLRPGVQKR
eukprot:1148434-Pelagomonas_calceolata.AAC.4